MLWVLIEPLDGGEQRVVTETSFSKWQAAKDGKTVIAGQRSDGKRAWRIVRSSQDPKELQPARVPPVTPEPIKPILPAELRTDVAPAPVPALPEQQEQPAHIETVGDQLDPAGQPVVKKRGRPPVNK